MDVDAAELLRFDCPRCHTAVSDTFYGPCSSCRDELRATQGLDRVETAATEYVPKMNVTPNFIATKD